MDGDQKPEVKIDIVPYIVFESAQARNERIHRRDFRIKILLIILLFITNIGWLVYESQFDTYDYTQDGNGINSINTGTQGDINNGTETED